jgi:hypothetical protein
MKRYRPLSAAGLNISRSPLAIAALCGMAAQPTYGELVINLDATSLAEGPLATWNNSGTVAGNFASSGTAAPSVVTVAGVKGVSFNGAANNYLGPLAPDRLTAAGTRTIEAWVYNPTGSDFETIIAWGRRGGPDNSNSSFSHGVHPVWGAFGGWGAGDLDWQGKIAFGRWNYIVYTYDGATSTAYADGVLANTEPIALDTWAFDNTEAGNPLPFRVGAQNNANGAIETGEAPTMTMARIRVHDVALTEAEVAAKYQAEKGAFGYNDDDNDGLPNSYEQQYSDILSPTDGTDAAKDQDSDGLTTLQEFAGKTFPNDADSDDDGVNDGAEVNRVAGATDPLKADTDGDGSNDGAENTAGTDPLISDTDGDTYSDGQEAVHGSNPLVPGSVPTFAKPIIALDATALPEGALPVWTNQGLLPGDFNVDGNPAVTTVGGVKGVTFTGTQFYTGPGAPGFVTGGRNHTIEAWIYNPAAAGEETIFSWGRRGGPDGSNVSFNHGTDPTWGAVGHWGAPDIGWGDMGPVTGRWVHTVYTWDEAALTMTVYQNGEQANTETLTTALNVHSVDTSNRPLPFRVASQNEASGAATGGLRGSMTIARVRVHDRVLSATDITAKYTEEAGEFGLIDFDNDGLPTGYERQYPGFLNPNDPSDAAKDQDTDGLTNLEEFTAGTNIEAADSDFDGVNDGPEVKRAPAATNPLAPDTDGDGLSDGLETATDPTVADSDGDTFADGQEVFHGSNPSGVGSTPTLTPPVKLVDLNAAALPAGPLAVWPNAGTIDFPFRAGGTPGVVADLAGVKSVTLDGTQYYTGPAAPGFLAGDAPHTIDAWIFNPAAAGEETIFSWGRRGGPDGSNASFNHGSNGDFGAVGHWGAPDIGWNGKVVVGQWTHVAYTWDPVALTTTVYSNGQVANTEVLGGPLAVHATDNTAAAAPLRFLLGAQNEANGTATGGLRGSMSFGRVRVYDGVLDAAAIGQIYSSEQAAYTVAPLAFSAPVYDRTADRLTLKWSAVGGTTYKLEGTSDLSQGWTPVANGIAGDTFVIEGVSTKATTLYKVSSE